MSAVCSGLTLMVNIQWTDLRTVGRPEGESEWGQRQSCVSPESVLLMWTFVSVRQHEVQTQHQLSPLLYAKMSVDCQECQQLKSIQECLWRKLYNWVELNATYKQFPSFIYKYVHGSSILTTQWSCKRFFSKGEWIGNII